jgi:DNA sulfur modification protein DndB
MHEKLTSKGSQVGFDMAPVDSMDVNSYEFTAIRGLQARSAYYVIMVPLKLVSRLFRFDDDAMPVQLRAQRVLNKARIPAIARYITDHPDEYILSSLCACVDGDMAFEPAAKEGPLRAVGKLRIGMSATILINDGQHRRAAIEDAIKARPFLGDETVSVVVFADQGLRRSQQMFADLNMHAVRPTRSIRLLYNHRDELARLTRAVVEAIPLFRELTDLERTSISNRSTKLFTLSSFHQATALLIGKAKSGTVTEEDTRLAIDFWTAVVDNMRDWQRAASGEVSAAELRRDYIHSHGIALLAIGGAGAQLVATHPSDWRTRLAKLKALDWSRSNSELWEGRALHAGVINKSKVSVALATNIVIRALGLRLSSDAVAVESRAGISTRPRKVAA